MAKSGSNIFTLPFGELSPTSLSLPDNLTYEQWEETGIALGRSKGILMWAIGDWWNHGDRYGDRVATVKDDNWHGPAHQTCRDAGWVCDKFHVSLRKDTLSYSIHWAIAPLDDQEWRLKILDWAEKERQVNPKKPTIIEVQQKVKETKAYLTQGWTPDQAERKAQAEAGYCVVANMHDKTDTALIAWAEANDHFVKIDRTTDWGNPFEIPDDGERVEVVAKFTKFYLPHKNKLLSKIPELRGKVLGCWCHPEECHGHYIAEIVNREANGDGSSEQLADQLAEVDG